MFHAFGRVRRDPYIVYAISFVAIFVFVFSVVGNFGILDRQRTQMLPLYFVLLAAPLPVLARRRTPVARVSPARRCASRCRPAVTPHRADAGDRHARGPSGPPET